MRTTNTKLYTTLRNFEGYPKKADKSDANQEKFKKTFLRKYRKNDSRRVKSSRPQLKELCSRKRQEGNNLKEYIREFVKATDTIPKEDLKNSQRTRLLLKGLSRTMSRRIFRTYGLTNNKPETFREFKKVLDYIKRDINSSADYNKQIASEDRKEVNSIRYSSRPTAPTPRFLSKL